MMLGVKSFGAIMLVAAISARGQSPAITITTESLPAATLGVPYTFTFTATGGTPPYRWGVGSLPGTFSLNADTGALSGTAEKKGSFNFTVQVSDSAGASATKTLSITVNAPPLEITTDSPLFAGTTGQFYSQVFVASGGTPPYQWAITGGQAPPGLIFDGISGALTGIPTVTGSSTLRMQVTDAAGVTASKPFQLTVEAPRLTIVTASSLPGGTVGVAYSQKLSVTGGTPPYSWSLLGSIAGLSIDSTTGTLSGTPATAGTFSFTLQVQDNNNASTSKVFTLSLSPARLVITTSTALADGALGVAYTQQLTARGGVPPYNWSAIGLPEGLQLDPSTGQISGTPLTGGALAFTIKVTDLAHATALDLFHVNIGLPPAPRFSCSGLPSIAKAADQPTLRLSIDSPYPVLISGQLTLSFAPDVGAGDSTIAFVTGDRVASFSIPAGATEAQFGVPSLSLQTGTVAGTITLAAQVSAGGVDITPNPLPTCTARNERSAPVVTAAKLSRTDKGFDVLITGFSTAREVTQVVFHFKAAPGSVLTASDVSVPVEALFDSWYQDTASIRYGSQFTFTQPFTIQGDATGITLESVTLTNRFGSTTAPTS